MYTCKLPNSWKVTAFLEVIWSLFVSQRCFGVKLAFLTAIWFYLRNIVFEIVQAHVDPHPDCCSIKGSHIAAVLYSLQVAHT